MSAVKTINSEWLYFQQSIGMWGNFYSHKALLEDDSLCIHEKYVTNLISLRANNTIIVTDGKQWRIWWWNRICFSIHLGPTHTRVCVFYQFYCNSRQVFSPRFLVLFFVHWIVLGVSRFTAICMHVNAIARWPCDFIIHCSILCGAENFNICPCSQCGLAHWRTWLHHYRHCTFQPSKNAKFHSLRAKN